MVTTLNFKDVIDLPKWRPLAMLPVASSSNIGFTCDMRNNIDRHPILYFNYSSNVFYGYNTKNDGWQSRAVGPSLATAFTGGFFMSAQGPRGTIAAGATTTSFTLTTALPATVGINQLANRGDGQGFKVRVIGNAGGGSSGKTEERYVIANTAGTTPTIIVDFAFSFTPAVGDAYEFLSGRVFMLGNTNAAGSFKYYDVLTNSFSGNLATANLPASWADSSLVGLDELLVPYDRNPGEGFFGVLTATATTGGAPPLSTLTGQLVGGDCGVPVDMHRNFQIRIVQDTGTPQAAGQRRNISTHTAGTCGVTAPVYTLSTAWTLQPSATAQYVIENNGDRIIGWFSLSTNTNTYTISTNAWDVAGTIFTNRPVVSGPGMMAAQAFSIEPDNASPPNARHSFIYSFRGGVQAIDLFNIAGAPTGVWTSAITFNGPAEFWSVNNCSVHEPVTNQGRYIYLETSITTSIPQKFYRFDMKNMVLEGFPVLKAFGNSTPSNVKLLGTMHFIDGSTKLAFIVYFVPSSGVCAMFGLPITR